MNNEREYYDLAAAREITKAINANFSVEAMYIKDEVQVCYVFSGDEYIFEFKMYEQVNDEYVLDMYGYQDLEFQLRYNTKFIGRRDETKNKGYVEGIPQAYLPKTLEEMQYAQRTAEITDVSKIFATFMPEVTLIFDGVTPKKITYQLMVNNQLSIHTLELRAHKCNRFCILSDRLFDLMMMIKEEFANIDCDLITMSEQYKAGREQFAKFSIKEVEIIVARYFNNTPLTLTRCTPDFLIYSMFNTNQTAVAEIKLNKELLEYKIKASDLFTALTKFKEEV